jgi:hypothetical protein
MFLALVLLILGVVPRPSIYMIFIIGAIFCCTGLGLQIFYGALRIKIKNRRKQTHP